MTQAPKHETTPVDSGWYPVPDDGSRERYFTGVGWSTFTRPASAAVPQPVVGPSQVTRSTITPPITVSPATVAEAILRAAVPPSYPPLEPVSTPAVPLTSDTTSTVFTDSDDLLELFALDDASSPPAADVVSPPRPRAVRRPAVPAASWPPLPVPAFVPPVVEVPSPAASSATQSGSDTLDDLFATNTGLETLFGDEPLPGPLPAPLASALLTSPPEALVGWPAPTPDIPVYDSPEDHGILMSESVPSILPMAYRTAPVSPALSSSPMSDFDIPVSRLAVEHVNPAGPPVLLELAPGVLPAPVLKPLSRPAADTAKAGMTTRMRRKPFAALLCMVALLLAVCLTGSAAWQLWGSNWYTDQRQTELRAQLENRAEDPTIGVSAAGPTNAAAIVAPGDALARIVAPTIGLDAIVVRGVTHDDLANGPGWMDTTAFPGDTGNAVVSGHRTTYAAPFNRIDELHPGDKITVAVPGRPNAVFEVRETFIVSPHDTWVTNPTPGVRLTLTTCNPKGSARQRLIVQAEEVTGANQAAAVAVPAWQRSQP